MASELMLPWTAVGVPETFAMCTRLVRPAAPWPTSAFMESQCNWSLQDLWIKNINISMGLVNTTTLGMLLKLVAQRRATVDKFVTHRYALNDVLSAYDTFARAADTGALKVALSR